MTSVVTEKYDKMIRDGVFPIARWGKAEDVAEMIAFSALTVCFIPQEITWM